MAFKGGSLCLDSYLIGIKLNQPFGSPLSVLCVHKKIILLPGYELEGTPEAALSTLYFYVCI